MTDPYPLPPGLEEFEADFSERLLELYLARETPEFQQTVFEKLEATTGGPRARLQRTGEHVEVDDGFTHAVGLSSMRGRVKTEWGGVAILSHDFEGGQE